MYTLPQLAVIIEKAIDDIDTAGDIAKEHNTLYSNLVCRYVLKVRGALIKHKHAYRYIGENGDLTVAKGRVLNLMHYIEALDTYTQHTRHRRKMYEVIKRYRAFHDKEKQHV